MKHSQPLKTILLDMDGVLWHGAKPVIDIKRLFDSIQAMDLQPYCVTNNSTRSISFHLEKLKGFGVSLDSSQIITSAEATAGFLLEKFPQQGTLFAVGEEGLQEALQSKGFRLMDHDSGQQVAAVVVGLDRNLTYQDLDLATRYLGRGAFFVGTNPDLTIPTPTGEAPGAGTIIKGIEVASGKTPLIIGKPFSTLYSLALSRSNSLPEETLMIGDRLETDIGGAQQVGIRTALVLSGISTQEDADTWDPAPELVADDAVQVLEMLVNSNG
jgi:4-nitrophenyl phosphatase